jgi:hypothetical protein
VILDPDFAEASEDSGIVTLRMTKRQAEWASSGIADMLQWVRGWRACATEDQRSNDPMGTDALRELNIALKRAINEVDP